MVPALPEPFCARMRRQLGPAKGAELLAALDGEPVVSLRLNPSKQGPVPEGEAVPWCADGRYLGRRPGFTADPSFHGGLYYVQEAASQFVGRLLAPPLAEAAAPVRILDLCAAPGGKTTLYASLAGPDGLVVANEVVRQRAQVLADNVRKWGTGNTVVTHNDPQHLARFEGWFDVVAVDAPCSGEGMFRKTPRARAEWSEAVVRMCAARQSSILEQAWKALRPGGVLLYSTCTFNRTENEEVLEAFLRTLPPGSALPLDAPSCPAEWGIEEGAAGAWRTYRFLPGRTRSEGFFVAALRRTPRAGWRPVTPRPRRAPFGEADAAARRELERWVAAPGRMRWAAVGESCYGYATTQYDAVRTLAASLSVIHSGVCMGQLYKGRLKPDHSLALYAGLDRSAAPLAHLSAEQAQRYLRGEALAGDEPSEGIGLACRQGVALGWLKRVGARCNNLYPASLRILNARAGEETAQE